MSRFLIGPACFALDVIGVVPRLKPQQPQDQMEDLVVAPGSSALNLAYGLSKLGHQVSIFGDCAQDAIGRACLRDIQQAGIDASRMRRTLPVTYTAFVLAEPEAPRRTIFSNPAPPREEKVDWIKLMGDCQSDFFGMLAPALDTLEETESYCRLYAWAKGLGMKTFLEPCEDAGRLNPQLLARLLPFVDIFLPGIKELPLATGQEDVDSALRYLQALGVSMTAVKLGAKGCRICVGNEQLFSPGFAVPVRDLTGAGDGFAAGFLHGLACRWPLAQVGTFANAYGAANVMRLGPRGGMGTYHEVVEEVMKRYPRRGA